MEPIDITPIITSILEVLIALAITLITTRLIPWIKSKLDGEKLELLKKFIKIAVKAAEQLYTEKDGEEKLKYATETVLNYLGRMHLTFDEKEIRALIEAAVLELHKEINKDE